MGPKLKNRLKTNSNKFLTVSLIFNNWGPLKG